MAQVWRLLWIYENAHQLTKNFKQVIHHLFNKVIIPADKDEKGKESNINVNLISVIKNI